MFAKFRMCLLIIFTPDTRKCAAVVKKICKLYYHRYNVDIGMGLLGGNFQTKQLMVTDNAVSINKLFHSLDTCMTTAMIMALTFF